MVKKISHLVTPIPGRLEEASGPPRDHPTGLASPVSRPKYLLPHKTLPHQKKIEKFGPCAMCLIFILICFHDYLQMLKSVRFYSLSCVEIFLGYSYIPKPWQFIRFLFVLSKLLTVLVFPRFPLSYHRTLPRRLPTGISKLSSDCWFRISYDIRTYQFDQIPKEYYIPSQNTKIPNITPSMAAASIKWYQHPLTLPTHISWFPTFVGTQFEQQPLLYGLIMVCIQ